MASLAHLSDEIVGLVLADESSSLFALWSTGCRVLQAKIARSCGTFSIHGAQQGITLPRWPSILNELKALHSVHIRVFAIYEDLISITEHVKRLPSSITELELVFKGSEEIPFCNPNADANAGDDTDSEPSGSDPWSITKHFPSLKRLVLSNLPETDVRDDVRLSTASSAIFPDSLTFLAWCVVLDSEDDDFSLLPRGLTELHLGKFSVSLDQVLTLPRQLRIFTGPSLEADCMGAVPRSLVQVNSHWERIELTPHLAPCLPPGLQSLTITSHFRSWSQTGVKWQQALPKTLTYLYGAAGPPADFALLPKSITKLGGVTLDEPNLYVYRTPEAQLKNCWPSSLTDLDFSISNRFASADHVRILPDTLTKVHNILIESGTVWEQCHRFPRALIHLSSELDYRNAYRTSATADTKALPPGLTSLSCQNLLPPQAIAGLPRCLTTLTLSRTMVLNDSHAAFLADLPSTLKTVRMGEVSSVAFPFLPRSITHFGCTFLPPKAVLDFSTLPPSLITLELDTIGTCAFDPKSFATFPSSIRLLKLLRAALTIEHFIHLNQRIRIPAGFILNVSSEFTTKEHFATLSRPMRATVAHSSPSIDIINWMLEMDGADPF